MVENRAQRCDCHKLAGFWWVGGCVVLRADHVLWPFWSRTILRAVLNCSLMACHEARRLFRWEVEGSDELKEGLVQRQRRATFWSQHLRRYRSVFVKPVTPAQEAKTVVASGAAVLTFTHQRWRAVCRHSNVRGAALQCPCIRHTRPSSTLPVVCAALFVLRQPHLLVRVSFPCL